MRGTRITQAWVARHLPDRPSRAHKGTFGRLLVVAGSLEYAGAAILAALGAARSGVGLVGIASAESVTARLTGALPEAILLPLAEEAPGLVAPGGWRRLAQEAGSYDALVVGPGLGRQPATLRRVRNFVSELRRPAVVDADGLNALAAGDRWWRASGRPLVLTPHPGEFARLSPGVAPADLVDDDDARGSAAHDAAVRWNQVVVLKGAHTVVSSPGGDLYRSTVATPALATAGSGDVLAGIIGALLAGGMDPVEAAACGVGVHGAAGVLAEDRIGRAGVMARDIADLVPAAIHQLRGDTDR